MFKRALSAAGAAGLLTVGLAVTPAHADGSDVTTYPLTTRGGAQATSLDIGTVAITNDGGPTLSVEVNLTGELDPENSVATKFYQISAQAECTEEAFPLTKKDNLIPGKMEVQIPFPDGETTATFEVPNAEGCLDNPMVAVHADVRQLGNVAGYQEVVNGLGDVQFRFVTDAGNTAGSSYFDTTVLGDGPLAGTYDGYCVDIGGTVNLNTTYTGKAVSIFDYTNADGNIDNPENLGAVYWLINNYEAGDVITVTRPDLSTFARTLTSGDIQRAIWYIVDNTQSTAGLGNYNDLAAKQIADEALLPENNVLPEVLGCDDLIPVILQPNNGARQTTIGQTTFISLGVPCEDIVDTAMAMDWTVTENEGGEDRYGNQFDGNGWFGYVYAPHTVAAE